MHFIGNNGHANIDNFAELYSASTFSKMVSTRFSFFSRWLIFELEPYNIIHSKPISIYDSNKILENTNNHLNKNIEHRRDIYGLKQSQIFVHYNGFGIGYGKMSHWWGPGFHSSLVLSTNAPSQETYTIGTFKDILIGKLGFGAKVIVMPYISSEKNQLYFSGLKASITYFSDPIISFGLHRTYLSGDFSEISQNNNLEKWTIQDAFRLVIDPVFGQSKQNLSYTNPGTPGFDAWDQIISIYTKLIFPNNNFEIYFDIASDDNRANLIDLRAHWDHTLGYQMGFKKLFSFDRIKFLLGVEYLTTRVSNTFKKSFYRGNPNTPNFYSKSRYDYSTFKGRLMGAHSGSSSDDFIIMFGVQNKNIVSIFSYNKERHGLKLDINPELKSEYLLTFQKYLTNNKSFSVTFEYEKIKNFAFIHNKTSQSKLLWLSYSVHLNNKE